MVSSSHILMLKNVLQKICMFSGCHISTEGTEEFDHSSAILPHFVICTAARRNAALLTKELSILLSTWTEPKILFTRKHSL